MPLGLVWTLVLLGSEETMDLGRHCDAGLETLPAGAGAGLLKAILGAWTPVCSEDFSLSLVRLLK